MPNLTKQAISRLQTSALHTALFNGCYNMVVAEAKFARYRVELRVRVTHPYLQWQCGNKNDVELIYWKSCTGTILEIPSELEDLLAVMRSVGTMTDEEARNISTTNVNIFQQAMNDLGIAT